MERKEKIKPRVYCKKNIKSKEEITCAWDTETDGLNGPLQCITFSCPNEDGIFHSDNMVYDFIRLMMSYPKPHIWYAHNSEYDWRYLISAFQELDYYFEIFNKTDDQIYQIIIWEEKPLPILIDVEYNRIKYGGLDGLQKENKRRRKYNKNIPVAIMRDSMSLFPGTLKDFAKYYGGTLGQKLTLNFEQEKFDINNPDHVMYAIQDAKALRFSVTNFRKQFEELFGCTPGATLPGSALRAWQYGLSESEHYWCIDSELEDIVDKAYYGGIVFLTSIDEFKNCKSFDINSSYPSQMLDHEFPYGKPVKTQMIIPHYLGFYHVRVKTPSNLLIPILPTKNEKGFMQWRKGEFDTWISSIELEFALSKGYRLVELYEGLVFPETINPFRNFIDKCRDLKVNNDKSPGIRNMAKLLQNAFYGKFASKRIRDKLYIPLCEEDLSAGVCIDSETGIWSKRIDDYQMLRMPHWSAWITAHARLDLLKTVYTIGVEHVIYGDTDSITLKETADCSCINQHETSYGFFKLEKEWDLFRATAPKVYTGIIKGHLKGKVKGIPKRKTSTITIGRIHKGQKIEVSYESVPKFIQILKGKSQAGTGTIQRKRTLSSLENSSNWELEEKSVRPKLAIAAN